MPTAAHLRDKLRAASTPDSTETWRVRLHRAISWLARSEREHHDPDARFMFQWVALNAAYAREFGRGETERERARQFLDVLIGLDPARRLHGALFGQFTGPIRTLLDNRFVFEPFWTALREHDASNAWETAFAGSRKKALASIMQGDTATLLSVVFDRLYVLRNQLVHGGATWSSQVNRAQVNYLKAFNQDPSFHPLLPIPITTTRK
mgnify:CR=1 FL=1